MEEAKADVLARQVLEMHGPDLAQSDGRRRVYEGVAQEAAEALPNNARAAVIQRDEDNEAVVVAVDGGRLYLIEFESADDETVATVVTTIYTLDPIRDRVSREARHHKKSPGMFSSLEWRFEVAARTLTIPTHVGADGHRDDREMLAEGIGEALGWRAAPADPGEYRLEVI